MSDEPVDARAVLQKLSELSRLIPGRLRLEMEPKMCEEFFYGVAYHNLTSPLLMNPVFPLPRGEVTIGTIRVEAYEERSGDEGG